MFNNNGCGNPHIGNHPHAYWHNHKIRFPFNHRLFSKRKGDDIELKFKLNLKKNSSDVSEYSELSVFENIFIYCYTNKNGHIFKCSLGDGTITLSDDYTASFSIPSADTSLFLPGILKMEMNFQYNEGKNTITKSRGIMNILPSEIKEESIGDIVDNEDTEEE